MRGCASCGEAPGDGAFCVVCGAPVAGAPESHGPPTPLPDDTSERLRMLRSDTAERPAIGVPPPPPPPFEPTSNARFPLYADQEDSPHGLVLPPMPVEASGPTRPPTGAPAAWVWWVLVVVALVAAGAVGAWLALRDDGTGSDTGADSGGPHASASESAGGDPDPPPPSRSLTGRATAVVPDVAPPNQDLAGRVTTYGPDNLFDGQRTTAWRMPGNGRGELITIRFPRRVHVTEVGLINGYAKSVAGGEIRWYPRNRRVIQVRWSFDDGSVLTQDLQERPLMQTFPVDTERTRTIRLRLLRVSAPGGRDFTAISEIGIWGR